MGDCCSCDCGVFVTETEVNGTVSVETVYNGTVTVETTFANGTTVVHTDVTDEGTFFTCGVRGYACVDPSSSCVDDDDYTPSDDGGSMGDDDGFLDACGYAFLGCMFDEGCSECVFSDVTIGPVEDDDDILDNCPLSSDTCSGWAELYCCAAEADMDEGCESSEVLLELISESINKDAKKNSCLFLFLCGFSYFTGKT